MKDMGPRINKQGPVDLIVWEESLLAVSYGSSTELMSSILRKQFSNNKGVPRNHGPPDKISTWSPPAREGRRNTGPPQQNLPLVARKVGGQLVQFAEQR